ncbi:MAG: XRE family transcriptional regulator [Rhodothermales bacterium]|nr:XRE family transcriptional regulator [Rhodothermales bacterium]
MEVSAEHLRLILGLKLKRLRHEQGASLKDLAGRAGVSVSYLSEIEKGKKYPKPEKLLDLARALDVPFDELVSQQVTEPLAPISQAIRSPFLQAFPFRLFGIDPQDIVALAAEAPEKAGGLIRALDEVARDYDMRVKHFLFAALRAYLLLHRNHFPELEEAADAYRQRHGWPAPPALDAATLRSILEAEHGYAIDTERLPDHPELHVFRSVFREREDGRPELLVNGELLPEQQAFLFARELGFLELGLKERPATSSWVRVRRFEPVLNNYRASYFAGALLIPETTLLEDLRRFFARETWDPQALLRLMQRYRATPEMFFYRLAEVVPTQLRLPDLYFMRFTIREGDERYHLTKVLNMSRVPMPHGLRRELDYGKRWRTIGGVRALSERQGLADAEATVVRAQRSHFAEDDVTFFEISLSRPLSLGGGASSVTLGFLMDTAFRRTVRFWNDPAVPEAEVVYDAEGDRHRARVEALAELGVEV